MRSLDHLIRPRQQRGRDGEAEGLGGPHVHEQTKRRWLLDREIGGLGPLEDLVDEHGGAPAIGRQARPVGYETTDLGILPEREHAGDTKLPGELGDLSPPSAQERIRKDHDPADTILLHGREGHVDVVRTAYLEFSHGDRELPCWLLRLGPEPRVGRISAIAQECDRR